jgi:hypothetical protein
MAQVPSRVWVVKVDDGNPVTLTSPSFRQVIGNPAGPPGSPVPLEDNVLEIHTQSGIVKLAEPDILSGERTDNGFRFRTSQGQFIGVPQMTPISRVVITGLVGGNTTQIDLDSVLSFGPENMD